VTSRNLMILVMASLLFHPTLEGAQVDSPVLGYVFDAGVSGLRPIWGVLGSSRVGVPLDIGGIRMSTATVSPRQDYALGISEQNSQILLLSLEQNPTAVTTLLAPDSAIERVVVSPMGRSVVLVPKSAQSLRVISGLPDSPQIPDPVGLAGLAGGIGAVAVRDDGRQILLAMQESDGDVLYAADLKGAIHGVARLGRITAMEYMRQGNDALLADADASQILRVRATDLKVETVAALPRGAEELRPLALAVSDDSQRVFVAAEGQGQLYALNLRNSQVDRLPFSGKATGLNRLKGNSVFRLNEMSDQPLLVLNGDLMEPGITFVPVPQKGTLPDTGLFLFPREEPRPVRVRERRTSQ